MGNRWPFALFVLVELSHKAIDDILAATFGGYAASLLLVTDNYEDAPAKQAGKRHEGTRPLIPKDFKSPWIGKSLNEVVEWLQAKPDNIDLNARHFAILDKGASKDPPTIVVCRIGDFNSEGDQLFLMRLERLAAVEHLVGAPGDTWDEHVRYRGNAEIEYDNNEA